MEPKNLIIVDDHPFFLHGLEKYLSSTGKYAVRSAGSVRQVIALLDEFQPDLLIMDISMAEGGGMALLRQLDTRGTMRTMFLTVQIDPEDVLEALKLGIHGIALKDRDPEEIVAAIDSVLRGQTSIDPAVAEGALRFSISSPTPSLRQDDLLTPRESAIVDMVCRGMRNREIADILKLTEGTVKVHLHHAFRRLGVSSRSELIVKQGGLKPRVH